MKKSLFILFLLFSGIVLVFASKSNESPGVSTLEARNVGIINSADKSINHFPSVENLGLLLHGQISKTLKLDEEHSNFRITSAEVIHSNDTYVLETRVKLNTGKIANVYTLLGVRNHNQLFLSSTTLTCIGSCFECKVASPGSTYPWCECTIPGGGNPPVCQLLD